MAIDFESQVPPTPESRPYKVGIVELLTRTLDLWISGLLMYMAIVLPFALIESVLTSVIIFFVYPQLLSLVLGGMFPYEAIISLLFSGANAMVLLPLFVVVFVTRLVLNSIVTGAVVKYGSDRYLRNTVSSVSECIGTAVARLPSLIAVKLLLTVISLSLVLPLLSSVLLMFVGSMELPMLYNYLFYFIVLFAVTLVISLYLGIRLILSPAMPVLETKPAVESLKRSWALTHSNFWHIFAANLLFSIVISLIGLVVTSSLLFLIYDLYMGLLLSIVSLLLIGILTTPLSSLFLVVLYGDLDARSREISASYW